MYLFREEVPTLPPAVYACVTKTFSFLLTTAPPSQAPIFVRLVPLAAVLPLQLKATTPVGVGLTVGVVAFVVLVAVAVVVPAAAAVVGSTRARADVGALRRLSP